VLKATNVDGVYDADPKHNPNASLLETVSYHEVTSRDLSVMDMTAITLCQENNIPGMDGIGFGSFGCFSPCFEFVIWCIILQLWCSTCKNLEILQKPLLVRRLVPLSAAQEIRKKA
jgi:hypothetical protein